MYGNIPFLLSVVFVVLGFVLLAWSSDAFVAGASVIAKVFKISPFIIGMVIIGFGTSAPELCVSVMSGVSKHSGVSLGNAYGSCIFNIAFILGIASLIRPLAVKPLGALIAGALLTCISCASYFLLKDADVSRMDAAMMLVTFLVIFSIYCYFDQKSDKSACKSLSGAKECNYSRKAIAVAALKLVSGLSILIFSSHILVWGAVDLARFFKVDDLVICLTIVAVGTSLPELASAIASARRGEHEFVLGNIVGSNFFNTLAVVGLAAFISPVKSFSPHIITRDLPMMIFLSLSIALFSCNSKFSLKSGKIGRFKGFLWVLSFILYSVVLFYQDVNKIVGQ
jgi:cation:H+ antiporter